MTTKTSFMLFWELAEKRQTLATKRSGIATSIAVAFLFLIIVAFIMYIVNQVNTASNTAVNNIYPGLLGADPAYLLGQNLLVWIPVFSIFIALLYVIIQAQKRSNGAE